MVNVQAKIAANEIMARMNRIEEIWAMLDRYATTGSIEAVPTTAAKRSIEEMSRPELIRLCFTIHPNITKIKKRISAATDQAIKTELQIELAIRQAELQELINIRNNG